MKKNSIKKGRHVDNNVINEKEIDKILEQEINKLSKTIKEKRKKITPLDVAIFLGLEEEFKEELTKKKT